MKIYGKKPGDIYKDLPWQYKIIIACGVLFNIFVVCYFVTKIILPPAAPPIGPLPVAGINQNVAIFDPSLTADSVNKTAVLAMTHLSTRRDGTEDTGIYLAAADKNCKNWRLVGSAEFEAKRDDLIAPDGRTLLASGTWRYETPSIVFDPGDTDRPWKLFSYKYFWSHNGNLSLARRYGMIVLRTAAKIEGPWSAEQWLFSAAADYPPPPYQDLIQNHLNTLDASLAGTSFYARPSVIYDNGVLLMTLSAFNTETSAEKIILLVSTDHAKTWRYVGAPLSRADIAKKNEKATLLGASLLKYGERYFLATVLGDGVNPGIGTFMYPFSDITKAALKKDGDNNLSPVSYHPLYGTAGNKPTSGGFAAWNDACATGTGLLSATTSGGPALFRIIASYHAPVKK